MSTPYMPPVGQPIGATNRAIPSAGAVNRPTPSGQGTFESLLRQQLQGPTSLKLSAHAESRLKMRGVSLSSGDWNKVESAVNAARQKGSKDAYVVYGQVGLIVNVPNSTVVTALEHGPQTVVTNIDSVVVV